MWSAKLLDVKETVCGCEKRRGSVVARERFKGGGRCRSGKVDRIG